MVVIAPLVPMVVGDEFEQGRIPLHLTLLPKFRVSYGEEPAVVTMINEVAAAAGMITATCAGYASFGGEGEVRVSTVEASVEIRRLHDHLLERARQVGGVPVRPAYSGDGYRPHVTHTDGQAPRPGEQLVLTALAVLDCTRPTRRVSAVAGLVLDQDQGRRSQP
jgi:hypothetical protein